MSENETRYPRNIVFDPFRGEYIDVNTGEVIEDHVISFEEPERFYDFDQFVSRSHYMPTSPMYHDFNVRSGRSVILNSEIALARRLSLVNRFCDYFKMPQHVCVETATLARKYCDGKRSAPCIIAIYYLKGAPVSLVKNALELNGISWRTFNQYVSMLMEHGVKRERDPRREIMHLLSEHLTPSQMSQAKEILDNIPELRGTVKAIAATIYYIVSGSTMKESATLFNVSPSSIRNTMKKLKLVYTYDPSPS